MTEKDSSNAQKISKKEQRRQEMAREQRTKRVRVIIPIVVVLLAFLAFVAYRAFQPEIDGVTKVAAAPGAQHDDELQIAFGGLPPMGGAHASTWQNCGTYAEPVAPQYAIHSMEHGAVWVSYHPDLPADQIAALQEMAQDQPELLLSPYPEQSSPIVLTSWDRQLPLDSANDERVEEFVARYQNKSGPEASTSCQGGVGVPTG